MLNFLRLVRFPNLLMIALVQSLLRWCIMSPIMKSKGFELQTSNFDFCLLVLSTMLLAAAGYVINDYFDRKTDLINQPGSVLIWKTFSGRFAIAMHSLLNTLAVITGIVLVIKVGLYKLSIIYLIVPAVLLFYSAYYKRRFLSGNLIIALFIALIPMMVALFEAPLLRKEYRESIFTINYELNHVFFWIAGYSFFAFLMALVYMIIKDIEHYQGDVECGRKTLPAVLGINITRIIVVALSLIIFFSSAYIVYKSLNDEVSILYFLAAIVLPMIFMIIFLMRSYSPEDFRRAGIAARIILIAGIFYILVAGYILNKHIII